MYHVINVNRNGFMKYLNNVSYKDCVGKVYKSKSSGDFKILKYNDTANVEIQFVTTGYEMFARLGDIRKGEVRDPHSPSVCGVGVVGAKYSISEVDVHTREYELWKNMLRRCYSDSLKKKRPTYKGCKVSDNFKSYEYFYEWCHKQIGFGNEGWQLDKDLLTKGNIKGNKVYSENVCVFLPQEINSLLVKREASRGKHLIGVYWHKKSKAFVARVAKNKGKSEYLGSFKTELEAFNAYKKAKESFVKEQANKWKSQIDIRAYNALMNYTVEITD